LHTSSNRTSFYWRDYTFAKNLSGRIFVQVQDKGQAWYIDPINFRKYYLGSGKNALNILKSLSIKAKSSEIMKIMDSAKEAEYTKLVLAGEPLSKKEQEKLQTSSEEEPTKKELNESFKEEKIKYDGYELRKKIKELFEKGDIK
jgi:hypothetical protein